MKVELMGMLLRAKHRDRGRALAYAIDLFRADKEIVSIAVQTDGMALEMAGAG